MSDPFSNFSRLLLMQSSKQLSSIGPLTVSLPSSLQPLEKFLTELIIALNASSSTILNRRPLLEIGITMNGVILAYTSEKIQPEVTGTVDNIDDHTPLITQRCRLMSLSSLLLIKEKQQNIE